MALKKLEETVKGTRILIYGPAGTKKSRFALTFPGNIYIDSDQGADSYYGEFADNIVQVSDSTTYKEVMDDLRDLEDEVDTFEAITLDNFTKIFENQQHTALNVAEQRAMKAGRNKDAEGLSYKDYGKMNLTNSIILSKLLEFKKDGKVIIVITEGKEEKEQISDGQGGTTTRVTGIIPNGPKSMQHLFDIVLETVKDKKTGETLGARVHKDRLGVVQEGTMLEDPTYDVWADVIEKRKKGVAKQAKKDIMRDLEHNEETMVGEDPTSIINEIKKILTPLTPAKKTEYQKALTSKFNTHKFMDETNIDNLKEMLNMIKQIAQ